MGLGSFWVCEALSSIPMATLFGYVSIFFGFLMRQFDKLSTKITFSLKYFSPVTEKATNL